MKVHAPTAKIKVVTKCERVQPVVVGIDENGEFIWEGRAMERWQMELLRRAVNFLGEFITRWSEVIKFEEEGQEFKPEDAMLRDHKVTTPAELSELRMRYPAKGRRPVRGD
jgi:hypothetical protein